MGVLCPSLTGEAACLSETVCCYRSVHLSCDRLCAFYLELALSSAVSGGCKFRIHCD
jgi:hypothetical protein